VKNASLEQVMDDIEKQSEFYFIFNQKQIDVSRLVNIQAESKLITDILPELFEGTNVNFAILDKKILLTTDPIENNLHVNIPGTARFSSKNYRTVVDAQVNDLRSEHFG
jgi:uncharacterized protein (UPF0248 family)